MKRRKFNINDQIGNYILLEKKFKNRWLVKCNCGHIYESRVNILHLIKHCKKCKPKGNKHYAWKGYGEIPLDFFTGLKHSSNAKNLELTVSIEYLWDLFLKQDRKCKFTGEEIYFHDTFKNKKLKTASLDRIDSSKGYIEGNLQWVHKDVNKLKKNFSDERFIEICLKISKHYGNSK